MIVESLWKHLKHRELVHFNRPRLDLVTHIVLEHLLPRLRQTLADVLHHWRKGRAKPLASWQVDMKAEWVFHSKTDEHRLVLKEVEVRKMPLKNKDRAVRLTLLEEEAKRENGTYHTSLEDWTCSCPSYLISRFLLCKHLVRAANVPLDSSPLTDLRFFLKVRRHHFPPFYHIPGIHTEPTRPNSPQPSLPVLNLTEDQPSFSEISGDEVGGQKRSLSVEFGDTGGVETEMDADIPSLDDDERSRSPRWAVLRETYCFDRDNEQEQHVSFTTNIKESMLTLVLGSLYRCWARGDSTTSGSDAEGDGECLRTASKDQ